LFFVFIGYWPNLEDINRWQHENTDSRAQAAVEGQCQKPTDTAPVIANPRPECGEAEGKGESDVQSGSITSRSSLTELDRTLRFYTDALGFTLKVRENHAQADHRSQRD